MDKKFTLGIIGAGNMAGAIVGGILASGLLPAGAMEISDLDATKLVPYKKKGLFVTDDNKQLATDSDYVLFAVKPQSSAAILTEIAPHLNPETVVISIMAGISIKKLASFLGKRNYARIMPNTPALIGEGMSAVAFSEGYRSEFVLSIFNALGSVREIDESLFDAVTSLSGSGPAYVYMFIKSLIDGGVDGGLDYCQAKTLAVQTVLGSAKMIENSDKPIEDLISAVCSKGGTTIQAVDSFRADGLESIIKRGMEKCKIRSNELGKE